MLVVEVQHKSVALVLTVINGALCIYVVLKVLVLVKMVRSEICYYSDVRMALHAVKLKRAELKHRNVILPYLRRLAEKRMTYVSAEVDVIARFAQKLGNNA